MSSLNKARLEISTSKNAIIKLTKEKNSNSAQQNSNQQKQIIADKVGGKSALELSTELTDLKKKFAKEFEKEKSNGLQQQKKIQLLEQKITLQGKELIVKENTINTLKQALDAKKDKESNLATLNKMQDLKQAEVKEQKQDQAQIKTLLIRIKDLESNEIKFKQEIKKLSFQIESSKKSAEVKKDGASDKIRIMEKKLEEAKQKEIELLKKIETLTLSLKKFTRAA
jgi:hypothetical protein